MLNLRWRQTGPAFLCNPRSLKSTRFPSLCNSRSLRMPIDRRGTPPIPLNFYHVITVIITSAGNGSYANKGRGAFLSAADAHVYVDVCTGVRHSITGERAILKYSGTAFFAGGAAYKKSGTIFLLGIPAFDIVSYVTAMTLFSCATHVTYVQHAHCSAAVSKLRQYVLLSAAPAIYSISAVTQSPCNSFRHAPILN